MKTRILNGQLTITKTRRNCIYVVDLKTGHVEVKKKCPHCGKVKYLSGFYKLYKRRDEIAYWCKKCCDVSYREWALRNRGKRTATSLAYQKKRIDEGNCASCGKPRNEHNRFCDKCVKRVKILRHKYYLERIKK
jgi:hypothetical protein